MVNGFLPFEPYFQVTFRLLAKKSGKKSNLLSISVVETLFVLRFSRQTKESLFAFEVLALFWLILFSRTV